MRKAIDSGISRAFRTLRFAKERLIAGARAGSWGPARLRPKIRFNATAIDQDGTLLLMPKEPRLSFYYVPLAAIATIIGAAAGFMS
jgi:hypothetical protein